MIGPVTLLADFPGRAPSLQFILQLKHGNFHG